MSSSLVPVTISQTSISPGLVSAANTGSEASATIPIPGPLDEAAVRLLADFFLLLADWDAKQKNRNLGVTLPGTMNHDAATKADLVVAEPTQINRRCIRAGEPRKLATPGRAVKECTSQTSDTGETIH
jgi:hypothetical protein